MKSVSLRYLLTFCATALLAVSCGASKEDAATAEETSAAKPAATPAAEPAAASTPAPVTEAAPAPAVTPAAAPAPAAAEIVVAQAPAAGTGVVGKVTFDGPAPKRPTLETEGDPKCNAIHADKPLLSDRSVVSATGGVQWAFAYIKNPPAGTYPAPTNHVELDQVGCAYVPHVLGVRVGQTLDIKNTDPTLHNVRGIARSNKPFNFGQPEASPARERIFDKPEMEIRVKCDIHSWMTGYLFAMDHPFFAVSDAEGNFNISGLPTGAYTLVVWHEAFGTQEVNISVTDGQPTPVTVTFKPAA